MCVSLFITSRYPNRWTKWAEIWLGGRDGPWDSLWVGVTRPAPSGERDRKGTKIPYSKRRLNLGLKVIKYIFLNDWAVLGQIGPIGLDQMG